jgi:hypothetical protein
MWSEHGEPLSFVLPALAPDESIGAEIEREIIASVAAANELKEIRFILISSVGSANLHHWALVGTTKRINSAQQNRPRLISN